MNEDAPRPLAGITWMLVTGVLFVGVTGVVKHVGSELPAIQSAFLRFVFGLLFFIPIIPSILATPIDRRSMGFFLARGVVHTMGVGLWFFAMARIPMAEVTAMNYLAPVYVTLGAALFLGEKLATRRLVAIGVALLGALVILRPGFRIVETGHIAMLGTALCLGASYLIAKRSAGQFDPATIVALLSLTVTILMLPFAVAVWVQPTLAQVGWLFLVAAMATGAHYTMTLAFRAAPVSVTQPVTFLQLIWATAIGWFIFGETLDVWVIAGGAMIISAISYIAWREAREKQRVITPAPEATKV
jgi:drug/metabolite transporter (DMT)-like permease